MTLLDKFYIYNFILFGYCLSHDDAFWLKIWCGQSVHSRFDFFLYLNLTHADPLSLIYSSIWHRMNTHDHSNLYSFQLEACFIIWLSVKFSCLHDIFPVFCFTIAQFLNCIRFHFYVVFQADNSCCAYSECSLSMIICVVQNYQALTMCYMSKLFWFYKLIENNWREESFIESNEQSVWFDVYNVQTRTSPGLCSHAFFS